MNDTFSVMSAQIAPRVGDIEGNAQLVANALEQAEKRRCDIVLCPELCLIGYPPQDLVARPEVIKACQGALAALAERTRTDGPACLIGVPVARNGRLFNAVALIADGRMQELRYKHALPNYGVFDEKRWFTPGPLPAPIEFRSRSLGVPICEDIWAGDVLTALGGQGAEIFLAATASPWEKGKAARRRADTVARLRGCRTPCVVVNQVGAQDELVFDGASFALDAEGTLVARLADFETDSAVSRWQGHSRLTPCPPDSKPLPEVRDCDGAEEVYTALMTGLRRYAEEAGFASLLLGLSGGVDSAVVAALCADALGPDRVHSLMMPFDHTSAESVRYAAQCSAALGISHKVVPIGEAVASLTPLAMAEQGVARQNIQSRIRGTILMTRANATGAMVVAAGNKSEFAVGYCTLYGDTCGGFAPLKDVYKTEVWRLARWRNAHRPKGGLAPSGREVVPASIIERPPSAELCEDQTDQDSLPPYPVLDRILQATIEDRLSIPETAGAVDVSEAMVREVVAMVARSEHKRQQAPPGVRVTSADFGRGRRYPIINAWRG